MNVTIKLTQHNKELLGCGLTFDRQEKEVRTKARHEGMADADRDPTSEPYRKRSRENTAEEKKAMKKARKRRKLKKKVEELKAECDNEKRLKKEAVRKYLGMSRTYWERWRWELQERRQTLTMTRKNPLSTPVVRLVLPSIDSSMLEDPLINGERKECYAGRGSFGIVRVCVFRGIKVAVKEFLPRTLREDVTKEAHILSSRVTPTYLVFLVCVLIRIVMQCHETDGKTTTLFKELRDKKLTSEPVYAFCFQLMEAISYLHSDVEILHNDITATNIVIENDRIILIDFGKAAKISEAKHYHLGEAERQEHFAKYPHLAPEVIHGKQRQSIYSDMYSVGLVLYNVCDYSSISHLLRMSLKLLAARCRSLEFFSRPKSHDALKYLQGVLI